MHKIDPDKCEFCGACKSACPVSAISNPAGTTYYAVDEAECIDCGACESECGFDAIIVE
jgi:NAD-dependent dihydropyrimidine dehydrogenase PreA subunit